MQRRLPKRGFRNPFPIDDVAVNVGDLERFDDGATVDEEALRRARSSRVATCASRSSAGGELTKKLTVIAHGFSAKATREDRDGRRQGRHRAVAAPSAEKPAS